MTGAPAIGNQARAKAVKVAEQIMLDSGFTDMKDNLREGDIGAKLTPKQNEMAEQSQALATHLTTPDKLSPSQRNMVNKFWSGNPTAGLALPNVNSMRAAAARSAVGETPVLTALQNSIKNNPLPAGTRRKWA